MSLGNIYKLEQRITGQRCDHASRPGRDARSSSRQYAVERRSRCLRAPKFVQTKSFRFCSRRSRWKLFAGVWLLYPRRPHSDGQGGQDIGRRCFAIILKRAEEGSPIDDSMVAYQAASTGKLTTPGSYEVIVQGSSTMLIWAVTIRHPSGSRSGLPRSIP
jgi:hypothetical protein